MEDCWILDSALRVPYFAALMSLAVRSWCPSLYWLMSPIILPSFPQCAALMSPTALYSTSLASSTVLPSCPPLYCPHVPHCTVLPSFPSMLSSCPPPYFPQVLHCIALISPIVIYGQIHLVSLVRLHTFVCLSVWFFVNKRTKDKLLFAQWASGKWMKEIAWAYV